MPTGTGATVSATGEPTSPGRAGPGPPVSSAPAPTSSRRTGWGCGYAADGSGMPPRDRWAAQSAVMARRRTRSS